MKQTNSRGVQYALKYLNAKYGFMLERGFEIVSVEDIPAGWQAVLRKSDLVVRILRARGEDDVSFRTSMQAPDQFFDIGSVVYAATGEKIPLYSYSDLSKELQKYIDKIEAYFLGERVKIQDSLRVAQKEYHETLTPGKEVSPKEPKMIPILQYPLMAIILLLIFGALTTLYMVLLDRLFSAFSLDPDSYGIFLGAVSLLLAIGTMFLFRGRRKKG